MALSALNFSRLDAQIALRRLEKEQLINDDQISAFFKHLDKVVQISPKLDEQQQSYSINNFNSAIELLAQKDSDINVEKLQSSMVEKLQISGKDFTGLNLCGVDFSDQDLTGAIFKGTKLHGANFTGTILKDAQFQVDDDVKAYLLKLSETDFSVRNDLLDEAIFDGADLSGANFQNASMQRSSFIDLKSAVGTNFTDANMDISNFTRANFSEAILDRTFMRVCDFTDLIIDHASIEKTDVRSSNIADIKSMQNCIGSWCTEAIVHHSLQETKNLEHEAQKANSGIYDNSDTPYKDLLLDLLSKNTGIGIGENHSDFVSRFQLAEALPELYSNGLRMISMEWNKHASDKLENFMQASSSTSKEKESYQVLWDMCFMNGEFYFGGDKDLARKHADSIMSILSGSKELGIKVIFSDSSDCLGTDDKPIVTLNQASWTKMRAEESEAYTEQVVKNYMSENPDAKFIQFSGRNHLSNDPMGSSVDSPKLGARLGIPTISTQSQKIDSPSIKSYQANLVYPALEGEWEKCCDFTVTLPLM